MENIQVQEVVSQNDVKVWFEAIISMIAGLGAIFYIYKIGSADFTAFIGFYYGLVGVVNGTKSFKVVCSIAVFMNLIGIVSAFA